MLSSLRRTRGTVAAKVTESQVRRPRRSRPALEALEGRQLLSSLGGETQVNPITADNTSSSASASSSNGSSVVVWVDNYRNSGDTDIWAQLYDATGAKVGSALAVDYTTARSSVPKVAMDSQGDFVVTWVNRTNASAPYGQVMAKYYTAAGVPATNAFPVYSDGGGVNGMDHPVVAMSDNSFVVAFEDHGGNPADGFGWQSMITAQLFTVTPGPTGPVIDTNLYDGTAHRIDVTLAGNGDNSTHPSIAMSPGGNFDIAYDYADSSGNMTVRDARYFFTGGYNTTIDVTGTNEYARHASVARDNLGNAVVAYEKWDGIGWGIYARRINAADLEVPGEIFVHDTGYEHDASVVMDPVNTDRSGGVGGGQFAVAYDTSDYAGGGSVVQVAVISSQASGSVPTALLGDFNGLDSNLSLDGEGHIQVTYTRQTGPTKTDVFVRRGALDGYAQLGGTGSGQVGGTGFGGQGPR